MSFYGDVPWHQRQKMKLHKLFGKIRHESDNSPPSPSISDPFPFDIIRPNLLLSCSEDEQRFRHDVMLSILSSPVGDHLRHEWMRLQTENRTSDQNPTTLLEATQKIKFQAYLPAQEPSQDELGRNRRVEPSTFEENTTREHQPISQEPPLEAQELRTKPSKLSHPFQADYDVLDVNPASNALPEDDLATPSSHNRQPRLNPFRSKAGPRFRSASESGPTATRSLPKNSSDEQHTFYEEGEASSGFSVRRTPSQSSDGDNENDSVAVSPPSEPKVKARTEEFVTVTPQSIPTIRLPKLRHTPSDFGEWKPKGYPKVLNSRETLPLLLPDVSLAIESSRAASLTQAIPPEPLRTAPLRPAPLRPAIAPLSPRAAGKQPERLSETSSARTCLACAERKHEHLFPQQVTAKCSHPNRFCGECVAQVINADLDSKGWNQITCPEYGCRHRLEHEDVRRLATESTFNRYDNLSARAVLYEMDDFRWCLASGCSSGQIHVSGTNGPVFTCVSCGHRACVSHDMAWHEGETCAQYDTRMRSSTQRRKNEAESAETIRRTTKKCPGPRCGWHIEKRSGCDHMTCTDVLNLDLAIFADGTQARSVDENSAGNALLTSSGFGGWEIYGTTVLVDITRETSIEGEM